MNNVEKICIWIFVAALFFGLLLVESAPWLLIIILLVMVFAASFIPENGDADEFEDCEF